MRKVKDKGFVSLESVGSPGMMVGLTKEGKVRPTVDTGDQNTRLYVEVIKCLCSLTHSLTHSLDPVKYYKLSDFVFRGEASRISQHFYDGSRRSGACAATCRVEDEEDKTSTKDAYPRI